MGNQPHRKAIRGKAFPKLGRTVISAIRDDMGHQRYSYAPKIAVESSLQYAGNDFLSSLVFTSKKLYELTVNDEDDYSIFTTLINIIKEYSLYVNPYALEILKSKFEIFDPKINSTIKQNELFYNILKDILFTFIERTLADNSIIKIEDQNGYLVQQRQLSKSEKFLERKSKEIIDDLKKIKAFKNANSNELQYKIRLIQKKYSGEKIDE